jgi:5-(carboxyamino)imidazole ribonucleotide mutase
VKVAVLMGSANDREKMAPAVKTLEEFGLETDEQVLSAHRTGAVAANTTLPVVGVPLSGGALNGVDALYATVQMPRGVPVATVAVDGALNAALLVVEMLAISDDKLARKLDEYRAQWGGQ